MKLFWDRMDSRKVSGIATDIPGLDFNKQENYPELMNEIIDRVLILKKAFVPYI